MSKTEEPHFTILESHHAIQIRQYPSLIVAQTETEGERQEAIREGFMLIAGYIFGNNKGKQKIAMTKPVVQQKESSPNQNRWTVRFFLPAEYKISDLPTPNENRVSLLELPPKSYAVIRFSGSPKEKKLEENLRKLESYLAAHGRKATGNPIYAFYNPPWTLPFLRRNEILLELV